MKIYSGHIYKNKLSIILDLNKQPLVNSIFIKKNFVYNSIRYKNHFFKIKTEKTPVVISKYDQNIDNFVIKN